MAVQVRLDLSDSVSVRDLNTFLNCLPQYVDATRDLRYHYVQDDKVAFLAVEFPSASRHSEAAPNQQTAE
ncbi:hypothetical protein [Sinomonas sp. RB5]